MATTIDEIQVLLSANTNAFDRKIADVQKQLSGLEKSNARMAKGMAGASKSMTAGMVAVGSILAGTVSRGFSMLATQAGSAVDRLDTLNNFPKVMANLGIGADESQKAVSFLSEKLKGLPTTLDTATMSVQRLTAVNKNLGASTQMFLAMNNAILAGGAGAEIQKSAIEQLSQAYSKGKPDIMEWRTLLQAMPAQLDQVAKSMGLADSSQLQQNLVSGKISMNDFMLKLVELNKTGYANFPSFEEQARNSTGGVRTSLINLQNAFVRAMTDIMNAVGQTNIAGFFNGITRMIDAVVPYIVGFVKVVVWAFGLLSSLFGGKQANAEKLNKSLKSASSGAGGVASGAEQADDALGGANKKAQKLAKQLASFDEMNVLKEPETSDGGGGGGKKKGAGGGAGGADLSGLTLPDFDTGISDKANEIAEKIKKALTDAFADFDFEAVKNAFKLLWEDIVAGTAPVIRVISELWNQYLFPMLKWAGDTLLPAVLNVIGGAIRLLGAIIGDIWDRFLKPFIDEFLAPIAVWTGGQIVTILNNIGNALRAMAQNESVVRSLTNTIVALGVAFTGIKIGATILSWLPAITNGISAISAWAGGFVSFGTALQGVGGFFAPIGRGISALVSGFGLLKGAFASLGGLIMAHPLIALGVVIAGLLLSNEDFRKSLMNLISTALQPLGQVIQGAFEALAPFGEVLANIGKIVGDVLVIAFNLIVGAIQLLAEALKPLMELLGNLIVLAFQPMILAIELMKPVFAWLAGIFNAILQPIGAFTSYLKDASAKTGELGNMVGAIFAKIMAIIQPVAQWVYSTLIQPIVNFIKTAFEIIWAVISKVIEIFAKIAEIVLTVVIVALKAMWEGIKAIFAPVVAFFMGIWNGIVEIFKPVAGFFAGIFNGAIQVVKNIWNGLVGFFQGLWGTLVGIFHGIATGIGNTVGGVFKGVINGILGFVEGFVNVPVRAINGLIDVINKVPGVSIGKLSPLHLPRLAKGGIIDHATMAIIGEAGKEAVMPLENNTGWITDLAGKIAERGGVNTEANSQPIEITIQIGEDQIAKKLISNINDLTNMTGRALIDF